MSFRRRVDHKRKAAETVWIERHWPTLKEIGLPPIVFCDYGHWTDFLDNGYLDHHEDTTRFSFAQLSNDQMRRLHRFLEDEHATKGAPPSLLGWLRVRFDLCRDCGNDLGQQRAMPSLRSGHRVAAIVLSIAEAGSG